MIKRLTDVLIGEPMQGFLIRTGGAAGFLVLADKEGETAWGIIAGIAGSWLLVLALIYWFTNLPKKEDKIG